MPNARSPAYVGIAARRWRVASACCTKEKRHQIDRRLRDRVDGSLAVSVFQGDELLDDGPRANTLAQIAVGTLAGCVRHILTTVRWFPRLTLTTWGLTFAGTSGTGLSRFLRARVRNRPEHLAADRVRQDQDGEKSWKNTCSHKGSLCGSVGRLDARVNGTGADPLGIGAQGRVVAPPLGGAIRLCSYVRPFHRIDREPLLDSDQPRVGQAIFIEKISLLR